MFDDPSSLLSVFLRFGHIIFGIIWIGHLYFLNLVNVPFQGDLDKDTKTLINPKLLLRVMFWFRTGAMYTFVFGWILFGYKYGHQKLLMDPAGGLSNRGLWMLFGGLLGTIMWINVWFFIWPRQKLILGGLAKGTPHPQAAEMGATALKFSRFNLYASGPMLFGMIMPNNYPGLSPVMMLAALIIGAGFWTGMVKRSKKIPTTVA
jgi:uncharacterized membrane protein